MDRPTMFAPRSLQVDATALISYFPIPFFGLLPVNAFVIHSAEPVLVDTGLPGLSDDFMGNLRSVIDPSEIRWIWMTHADPDHTGSYARVLAEAPNARAVMTFLCMGKMSVSQLPLDRVYLLNPGQSLDVGDRRLVAIRPPSFDAPETMGFFDTKTETLYSADSFGALMKEPAENAADIPEGDLRDGFTTWVTFDSPWLQQVDAARFASSVQAVRNLKPKTILSSHLVPAMGMSDRLLDYLSAAPSATFAYGPDQADLERAIGRQAA